MVGLAGDFNLLPGIAWVLIFSDAQELWSKFCFSIPYLLPFLLFFIASWTGFEGRLRISSVMIVLALVISAGLLTYDVTYHRAQYRIGANGPDCYVFWWWWCNGWADENLWILYTT